MEIKLAFSPFKIGGMFIVLFPSIFVRALSTSFLVQDVTPVTSARLADIFRRTGQGERRLWERDQMMQSVMMKTTADCEKIGEDVVRLISLYLGKHEFIFGISLLRQQGSPDLLRGCISHIFVGLLIWLQSRAVKRVCEQND